MSNLIEAQVCFGEGSTSCQPPISCEVCLPKRRGTEDDHRNIVSGRPPRHIRPWTNPVSVRKSSRHRERNSVPASVTKVKYLASGRNVAQKIPRASEITVGIEVTRLYPAAAIWQVLRPEGSAETNQRSGDKPATSFMWSCAEC